MYILPAIDLHGGEVVRLLQGDYDRRIDYHDDPVAVALDFEQRGARWLHVVDLDGARTGEPANIDIVRHIIDQTMLRVEVGGGVRTAEAVERLLDIGVERVVIGTRALREWGWFVELLGEPAFADHVCLGLDAREGQLAVEGWTESASLTVAQAVERCAALPLAAVIYTDISTDGMMGGPNVAAVRELAAACPHPLIASGGIRRVGDIRELAEAGAAGAIIGRALYEGRIRLEKALSAAEA